LTAKVTNQSNRDIELDSLVVHADYPSGGKNYVVPVAGKRLSAAPGITEAVFSIPESQGPQPTKFAISEFRFHTAGLPECASH
jgi:hypothetical protein